MRINVYSQELTDEVLALEKCSNAEEPVAWLRDLDGSGSLHPASKGDPGAFAVYRTAPPAPAGEVERLRGEIAYALTKRLVIDMPTARAAIDEAFAALKGGRSDG